MNIRYLLLISIALLPCICIGCEPVISEEENGDDIEHIYLDGYETATLSSEITSVQPMTGIVFWPAQAKSKHASLGHAISLEFSYCLPSDVVIGKKNGQIQYDWSSFETLLDDIASRGHQAIIRFRYEYPSQKTNGVKGGTAVPQYIKELSDYNETYNANPGGDGPTYYADWSNSELQWFTKQFYTDFTAKYDNDVRIAFVQVGFGHWSEYHIYGHGLRLGVNFPSHEYQAEFLTHVHTLFNNTPWSISVDAADKAYAPIVKADSLMALNFGLFDDSFMHKNHEISQGGGYNEKCWRALDTLRWQKSPAGGEISYYTRDDQRNFLNPDGMYGYTWEQAAAKYHITYIIGNDAPSGQFATPERMKEATLATGYRFCIDDFKISSDSAAIKISNKGIAPIYRDAYVAMDDVRIDYSLKQLLPENSVWLKAPIRRSDPEISIQCDHLLEGKKIEFEADVQ